MPHWLRCWLKVIGFAVAILLSCFVGYCMGITERNQAHVRLAVSVIVAADRDSQLPLLERSGFISQHALDMWLEEDERYGRPDRFSVLRIDGDLFGVEAYAQVDVWRRGKVYREGFLDMGRGTIYSAGVEDSNR